jgi:predicted transcriptional regulator
LSDVYELTPSMRLLLTMHSVSAVDPKSAKNIEELISMSNMSDKDLEKALSELVSFGYVIRKDHIYYLSSLGISVVRSVYT